jgi:hypothetical protein
MNTSGEKSGEKQETMINETETHDHDSQTEPLVLNNGKKWKVDDHMMVFIQDMEQDIKSFSLNDLKDYQLLADGLHKNINLLTTNCTMSGMAHDELHKWLVPYITEVNALSEAENETEACNAYVKIQDSFKTFNQYFQ